MLSFFRSDCPGVRPPGVQPCQGACLSRQAATPESSGGGTGKLDPEERPERESEEEEEEESEEPDHQVHYFLNKLN